MVNSKGYRRGTRHMFSRKFRKRGIIPLKTFMQVYKVGDMVNIKANAAVQKGMPHKCYHGRTGRIYNVSRRGLGVTVNKRVRGKILAKRICVRIEHVTPNNGYKKHLLRIRRNDELKREAKKKGIIVNLKRQAAQPREARIVSSKDNEPILVQPIRYDYVA